MVDNVILVKNFNTWFHKFKTGTMIRVRGPETTLIRIAAFSNISPTTRIKTLGISIPCSYLKGYFYFS